MTHASTPTSSQLRLPVAVWRALGSLPMAVAVLIAIGGVLAWGTLYELRFGIPAVQRAIYQAWWFQLLLAFLGLNLAIAALERYPWQRRHLPFVLAHLGIILILVGGIVSGRFGVEGQLVIPEGAVARTLQLPSKVLVVRQANPGATHIVPTAFETRAWVHEPQLAVPVQLEDRAITLTVDRYFPDATAREQVTDGRVENPAIRVRMAAEGHEEQVWLFARDPDRFGVGWGEAHVLFVEAADRTELARWLGGDPVSESARGVVSFEFPDEPAPVRLAVPETLGQPSPLAGTPYVVTFKEYFPDFIVTAEGLGSRSSEAHNPAVSLTLRGPEGTDAYLLFARHPEVPALHGWAHRIPVRVSYSHPAATGLPANGLVVVRQPGGTLSAVMTGPEGARDVLDPMHEEIPYAHRWLGYEFEITAHQPRARVRREFVLRGREVRAEVIRLIGREGAEEAAAWVPLGEPAQLPLGREALEVEYRHAQRSLPVTVKLLDFRKIDYPGTELAAGFESDVELTDPERGLMLMRRISMNNPLKYRGYSFYQASFIPASPAGSNLGEGEQPVEATVLAVRKDPGTPLTYTGFLIVLAGIVGMFVLRGRADPASRA